MGEKTEDEWRQISDKFYKNTNFPNCVGAIDGKHIRVISPAHSGSQYYNYKNFFSIVLLGLVDNDYCFSAIDVGAYGKSSDSNIFKNSILGHKLEANKLRIPSSQRLPNDTYGEHMPFIIVGDEAFALSKFIMRPYPNRNLEAKKRIFNYRLSRARRMVECAFGILANKWRIFHKPIEVEVDFAQLITQTCCLLHNFVRKRDGIDYEDTLYECSLENIPNRGTKADGRGIAVRDYFTNYFNSSKGAVSWQNDKI